MKSRKKLKYDIVLINDDELSFDHVIQCLTQICNHSYYQAVQCANIVNSNGRYEVYSGAFIDEATEVNEMLLDEGLDTELVIHSKK